MKQRSVGSLIDKGYRTRRKIKASRASVFRALTTKKGLGGWWTHIVSGSLSQGGRLRLEFEGLDEHIIMQINTMKRPSTLNWICVEHTSLPEWNGTNIHFSLKEIAKNNCELDFAHVGLVPDLACYRDCKNGWIYFLESLVSYVETGKGQAFA